MAVTYRGQSLEAVQQITYLGINLCSSPGLGTILSDQRGCMHFVLGASSLAIRSASGGGLLWFAVAVSSPRVYTRGEDMSHPLGLMPVRLGPLGAFVQRCWRGLPPYMLRTSLCSVTLRVCGLVCPPPFCFKSWPCPHMAHGCSGPCVLGTRWPPVLRIILLLA